MTDEDAYREFFDKALSDAGLWARYGDPKALAALAVLGLGLSNLLSVAAELIRAHDEGSVTGWIASVAFWLSLVCVSLTVLNVARSLFPRVRPVSHSDTPLYFFADIASFDVPQDYEAAVRSRTASQLQSEIAAQAWEVGRIATIKHRYAGAALRWVLAFLACWAAARLMLVLST
jgi:hypothetical protein